MEIVLLGSSGSIGLQTLDVVRKHKMSIAAIAARSDVKALALQAREFKPRCVCVFDEKYYGDLKIRLADTGVKLLVGMAGLCEVAAMECSTVLNAVVGMSGLEPTLAALEAGNRVALANKETIVAGGELVMQLAKVGEIIPVDSEHSAIFQCIRGNNKEDVAKIILTASGGAFYGYNSEQLKSVTREQALCNPNWSMGAKVTVDSATLMNKGLEFIEAMWLFGVSPSQIEVVIHRQSILHSAVEFADGAVIAQLGIPDMRVPIQYALTYPERLDCGHDVKRLSLADVGSLTFARPDEETFACLSAAKKAANKGNNACAILNAANEAAVGAFLQGEIEFCRIAELVVGACEAVKAAESVSLATIYGDSESAKEFVRLKI
ncbi:MAG: 1-deoxy-D-xylulose-5-phosphate reductoisomerase [Oscillospiraceae bacterium]|nr:1-deoxy-D-xylulose-5-phosphate reductoisomerase [Oscillospiraceae bacterium]